MNKRSHLNRISNVSAENEEEEEEEETEIGQRAAGVQGCFRWEG